MAIFAVNDEEYANMDEKYFKAKQTYVCCLESSNSNLNTKLESWETIVICALLREEHNVLFEMLDKTMQCDSTYIGRFTEDIAQVSQGFIMRPGMPLESICPQRELDSFMFRIAKYAAKHYASCEIMDIVTIDLDTWENAIYELINEGEPDLTDKIEHMF
jgi:hypothetical protein